MSGEISIDRDKCANCGACARDCVSGVLHVVNGRTEALHPEWCNRCGHCRAVCPAGAVINPFLVEGSARPVDRELLQPDCYREIMATRRSVRRYKDEPVPRTEVEEILDLMRFSPTASNTMDVGYVIVTDRARIRQAGRSILDTARKLNRLAQRPWVRRLLMLHPAAAGVLRYIDRFPMYEEWIAAGRDPLLHNAPALVLIHGPAKSRFAAENCAIAATNFSNYAHARGLGTCHLGLLVVPLGRDRKLRRLFSVPAGRVVYMALSLGKPDVRYRQTPERPPVPVTWV